MLYAGQASAFGFCVLQGLFWYASTPNDPFRIVSTPLMVDSDWQCHTQKPRFPAFVKDWMRSNAVVPEFRELHGDSVASSTYFDGAAAADAEIYYQNQISSPGYMGFIHYRIQ